MSVSRLSHVVAVSKSVKSQALTTLTNAHHKLQRVDGLKGLSRKYQPLSDDEHQKPAESTRVQVTATEVIAEIQKDLVRLFDVTATQDYGNTEAHANVAVDGLILVYDAPVSYLLFLEKQLVDLATFIKKLPTLDPSESWSLDAASGHYRAEPVKTVSTKKIMRNHVKAEATDKHPAQVEVYYEDAPVGHWETVKFSGALPATRVKELSDRVAKLQEAVKVAREEANAAEVTNHQIGEVVLSWLFA